MQVQGSGFMIQEFWCRVEGVWHLRGKGAIGQQPAKLLKPARRGRGGGHGYVPGRPEGSEEAETAHSAHTGSHPTPSTPNT